MKLIKGLLLTGLLSVAGMAHADSALTTDFRLGLFSDYLWRGFNLYDGTSIQPSIASSLAVGPGTLTGSVWGHLSGEGSDGASVENFTEVDYTLSYSIPVGSATFTAGHLWYTYPDSDDNIDNTAEVFGSIALAELPLSPVVSVFHDYDLYDATYIELGLSHVFDVGSESSLTPYVAFGFGAHADKYYAEDGLVQTTVGANLQIPVDSVSVIPGVHYTFESDANATDELWFGTTVSYVF